MVCLQISAQDWRFICRIDPGKVASSMRMGFSQYIGDWSVSSHCCPSAAHQGTKNNKERPKTMKGPHHSPITVGQTQPMSASGSSSIAQSSKLGVKTETWHTNDTMLLKESPMHGLRHTESKDRSASLNGLATNGRTRGLQEFVQT